MSGVGEDSSDSFSIEEFLLEWSMPPDVIASFKAAEVDLELFFALDITDLLTLLPNTPMCMKLKLLKKIKDLKSRLIVLEEQLSVSTGEEKTSAPADESINSEVPDASPPAPFSVPNVEKDSIEAQPSSPIDDDIHDTGYQQPEVMPDSDSDEAPLSTQIKDFRGSVTVSKVLKRKQTEATDTVSQDASAAKKQAVDVNRFSKEKSAVISAKGELVDLDLKDMLNSTLNGRALLSVYEREGTLQEDDRNSLTDICVKWLLLRFERPKSSDFTLMKDKILGVFPNEVNIYYILPVGGDHALTEKEGDDDEEDNP